MQIFLVCYCIGWWLSKKYEIKEIYLYYFSIGFWFVSYCVVIFVCHFLVINKKTMYWKAYREGYVDFNFDQIDTLKKYYNHGNFLLSHFHYLTRIMVKEHIPFKSVKRSDHRHFKTLCIVPRKYCIYRGRHSGGF
jgi:hypothetical protein